VASHRLYRNEGWAVRRLRRKRLKRGAVGSALLVQAKEDSASWTAFLRYLKERGGFAAAWERPSKRLRAMRRSTGNP